MTYWPFIYFLNQLSDKYRLYNNFKMSDNSGRCIQLTIGWNFSIIVDHWIIKTGKRILHLFWDCSVDVYQLPTVIFFLIIKVMLSSGFWNFWNLVDAQGTLSK